MVGAFRGSGHESGGGGGSSVLDVVGGGVNDERVDDRGNEGVDHGYDQCKTSRDLGGDGA